MPKLTHFDESGAAHMVDVSDKDITARIAVARGRIVMDMQIGDLKDIDALTRHDPAPMSTHAFCCHAASRAATLTMSQRAEP